MEKLAFKTEGLWHRICTNDLLLVEHLTLLLVSRLEKDVQREDERDLFKLLLLMNHFVLHVEHPTSSN
jgi:hypothetical protein